MNSEEQRAAANQIHIEQLEVFARVGVTENERDHAQRLRLNITAWPEVAFENLQDDISRTVNYSALAAHTRDLVGAKSWRLIETLAAELARRLLTDFPLQRVQIELQKFVLPDAEHVAVLITRTKTDVER